MKRLRHKKGFTLVECIVAMAVLAIMSLMLTMMLNITITTRNRNMEMERQLDKQVGDLAKDEASAQTVAFTDNINFNQSGGSKTFSIPGDGSDGVEANKKYYNNGNQVGKMDYDFDNYFANLPAPADVDGGAPGSGDDLGETGGKYGGGNTKCSTGSTKAYITPQIYFSTDTATAITPNEGTDPNDAVYTVSLTVEFTSSQASPERSLKIILPIGAEYVGSSYASNCVVDQSMAYSVRIQPGDRDSGAYGAPSGETVSTAKFSFNISKKNYFEYYKNTGGYFNGTNSAEGSKITVLL